MEKVAVFGKGGREHSLAWKLAQSTKVKKVYCVPGNAGTSIEEKVENVFIDASDPKNFQKIYDFVRSNDISMVVVGPEDLLHNGIVSFFNEKGYGKIFGPRKSRNPVTSGPTDLEADKFYSWSLMNQLQIPQAEGKACWNTVEARQYILGGPYEKMVLKARGLTLGKGVTVCDSREEALEEIIKHSKKYGEQVLISRRLYGQEFSVFGLSDGKNVKIINAGFQDHKARDENDEGLNTGGMGAYGPAKIATEADLRQVEDYMQRIVDHFWKQGMPYIGFLYAGMMKTEEGLKVIEWNARMGDPECQPAMMLLNGDLYNIVDCCLRGDVNEADLSLKPGYSCCVCITGPEYPEAPSKGKLIFGLPQASKVEGVKIFHAGTMMEGGEVVTNGGRILNVTSYHPDTIFGAKERSYKSVRMIKIQGGSHYRPDIADKALN